VLLAPPAVAEQAEATGGEEELSRGFGYLRRLHCTGLQVINGLKRTSSGIDPCDLDFVKRYPSLENQRKPGWGSYTPQLPHSKRDTLDRRPTQQRREGKGLSGIA
jgi:hypothetical protein